jgi:hypothetical protein
MTKLDTLRQQSLEQIAAGTFDMNSELAKQINEESQKHVKALEDTKVIALMDKEERPSINEVAELFNISATSIRKTVKNYYDEFNSDGYSNGRFTKRSILRLSMFTPSDNILAEKIKRHILNVAV